MTGQILLIDHSVPLSRSVAFVLTQNGYHVDAVRDEESALHTLASDGYDLIIINLKDIAAYGSKILDFLQNRRDASAPPVLGLTTPEGERDSTLVSTAGVTEWLSVPFSNEKLLNCIKKIW